MGQRGPGARPARTPSAAPLFDGGQTAPSVLRHKAKPWDAPGLSRAARVMTFLEALPVTKGIGQGQPMRLLPFQRDFIDAVYAIGDDGRRLVSTALLSVARGNGKTVLIGGLCLAHLIGPESEQRGEVYSAASSRDQAALVFGELNAWIVQVPWMRERLNVQKFHKVIEDAETGSIYRALASDAAAVHGLASSFVVADELAQWKRRELFDVLRTSLGKRREPLLAVIGTQSASPTNIMSELIDYGQRVKSGEVEDPSFYAQIHTVPDDADAWDETLWPLANPALGTFRSLAEMQQEAKRAQRMPTFEPAFRNLYLNQRVEAEPRAINPAEWAACDQRLNPDSLKRQRCFGGLDLSTSRDMTAFVLFFPESGALLPRFWLPREGIAEKSETDRVPYVTWAQQGHLELTPGAAIDKAWIAHALAEAARDYDLQAVAYDRWRIDDLKAAMAREGITGVPLEAFGQGFKDMGAAVEAFETALAERRLAHGGHPILRWCASNLIFETDPAGNRKPNKSRSTDRIDGIVAAIMAIGAAARATPCRPINLDTIGWI